MKNILKQIAQKSRQQENEKAAAFQSEISNPGTKDNRRDFLKKTGAIFGGISLSSFYLRPLKKLLSKSHPKSAAHQVPLN